MYKKDALGTLRPRKCKKYSVFQPDWKFMYLQCAYPKTQHKEMPLLIVNFTFSAKTLKVFSQIPCPMSLFAFSKKFQFSAVCSAMSKISAQFKIKKLEYLNKGWKFGDHFYIIDVYHLDIQNAHSNFQIIALPKKLLAKNGFSQKIGNNQT